jgi:hypothetical protein
MARFGHAARELAVSRTPVKSLAAERRDIADISAPAALRPEAKPGPPRPLRRGRGSTWVGHVATGARAVALVAAPEAGTVAAARSVHPLARLRPILPKILPDVPSVGRMHAPRPGDLAAGSLTDTRRLLQIGVALALAYLLFLMFWFWRTRAHHRGTGGRPRV